MPDFHPTDEQLAILQHDVADHARIVAGPGTGKSATIVALIDDVLAGAQPPRLRLLTFTRAATGELAKKVSEHPSAAAERPSTIHSFAISLLLRNPGAANLPEPLRIADDWEYQEIVRPSLARRLGIEVRVLDRLVREMAANWESLVPEEDPEVDPAIRARFTGAWNEHRRIYGYTLLQELPYGLRKALLDHPDLDGVDYDLLVVDEYQDLNACDLEVIRLIADRGCSVIAAGDDDQSIYGFRKAAPEGIRRFVADYAGAADYTLSVTQRCGERIIDWARHVIEGDPDRPERPRLHPAEGSPRGEVALLGFATNSEEAHGIATLVHRLVEDEGLDASQVLILLRSDFRGSFSDPIKRELDVLGIEYSDPEVIDRMLADEDNRRLIALFRLLVEREDSLAWATLLELENGVGEKFFTYVYERARAKRTQFGSELIAACEEGLPGAPAAPAQRVAALVATTLAWADATEIPDDGTAWGDWILGAAGNDVVPTPSVEFETLLQDLDELTETREGLGRFLGQIAPLGKDIEANTSQGVRIMSMASAKGLTVDATIIGALEDGLMPRPDVDLEEERRLLYVGMTRARRFLFATWARTRTGPTARAGRLRVGARRSPSSFFDGGPVTSERGADYIDERWNN